RSEGKPLETIIVPLRSDGRRQRFYSAQNDGYNKPRLTRLLALQPLQPPSFESFHCVIFASTVGICSAEICGRIHNNHADTLADRAGQSRIEECAALHPVTVKVNIFIDHQ